MAPNLFNLWGFMEEIENTLKDIDYDDGVYILATRRNFLSKNLEYRIAHITSVDKLYGDFGAQGSPEPVKHLVKEYFANKPVFKSEADATSEALRIHEEIGGTDYGIGVIYVWASKTFKQIIGE